MRIALLYRDALKQGGYPRDARWLAGSLARHGAAVSLIAESGDLSDGLTDGVDWIDFRRAWMDDARWDVVHELFGVFIRGQATIARRLRAGVHVVSPGAHLMPAHLARRWWKKVPYVAWWRVLHSRRCLALHVFSRTELRSASAVFPRSRSFEASLGIFPPPRVPSIASGGFPWGGDPALSRADFVLFFGRNDVFQKGIDVLVRGFARAVALGLTSDLWIAGQPWRDSEAVIRRLSRKLEVEGRVVILGAIEEQQKWELLRHARCLAFLSRWDGPPRPIREALSVGTPVIVSPGTNMAELVTVERAGAATSSDPEAVARALLASSDEGQLHAWRAGVARLVRRLTWEKVAASYLEGYHSLLAGRGRRPMGTGG